MVKKLDNILARFNVVHTVYTHNVVFAECASTRDADVFTALYPAGINIGTMWVSRKPYSKFIIAVNMEAAK